MEGTIPELFVLIEPNCPNVTGLTGTMDSLGNVDISWDSTDNQTKWVVHFTGPGVMETDTVTSCHKHYSGLYPNQAYSVKVNARCYQSKYNIWSGWGETIWIGNTTGSIDEAAAFGFTLKPNPAMGKASVSSEGYDGAATVSVTTVDGIEVLRHDNTTLPLTLDLAGLASGVYMVRVGTARGTATKRLVVQ
ncbi:MAG: T9SS type A sorting domain-containing protein [Bacteroidales bacterium]|nr:T9SS type A sorting domain-containing protein [Bacteroidales bacterium]